MLISGSAFLSNFLCWEVPELALGWDISVGFVVEDKCEGVHEKDL